MIGKSIVELGKRCWSAWRGFWFIPQDPLSLAAIRIGTCSVLLYSYLMVLPDWSDHYGPFGWIDQQAARGLQETAPSGAPLSWSLWMLSDSRHLLAIGYGVLLLLLLCGAVGFKTKWVLPCAWICHISLAHRGMVYLYGVDLIGAMLLLYLSFAPSGTRWSWDSWRKLTQGEILEGPSVRANIALRCIQVHLCVIYASAGLSKLAGPKWWSGTAVWYAAMTPEMWPFGISPTWLMGTGFLGTAIVNLATLGTLILEIAFAFLIWNSRLRPMLLWAVGLMHVGTGLLMSLGSFAAIMVTALLAFAPASAWVGVASYFMPAFRLQRLDKPPTQGNANDRLKHAA